MTPAARQTFLDRTLPWVEHELFDSILRMHLYREVYRSWNDALDMTSDEVRSYGLFHDWVRQGYVALISMAIRREGDLAEDSTSLRRFLETVHDNAQLLGRNWYLERFPTFLAESAARHWAEIATSDGSHINPDIVESDIALLADTIRKTRKWATANIAHRLGDREGRQNPNYQDVHAAVDEIERLWRKWHEVLTATSVAPLEPEPWESVLTVPWITEDQADELFRRRRESE